MWILDEGAAGSAEGCVELVSRRVLDVAVQNVASDQARLTDAVEELVAALLRLVMHGRRERAGLSRP